MKNLGTIVRVLAISATLALLSAVATAGVLYTE